MPILKEFSTVFKSNIGWKIYSCIFVRLYVCKYVCINVRYVTSVTLSQPMNRTISIGSNIIEFLFQINSNTTYTHVLYYFRSFREQIYTTETYNHVTS